MSTRIKIFYSEMQSPVGPLLLATTDKGLFRVEFRSQTAPAIHKQEWTKSAEEWMECPEKLADCEEQLVRYFDGELKQFSLPLDLRGTDFQVRCWEALLEIPYGTTCTYGEIAQKVGRPHAFRAVGQANHNNPLAIIVPCHRVIGSNGTLTGYGGGLGVKEKLLLLESGQLQPALAFAAKR